MRVWFSCCVSLLIALLGGCSSLGLQRPTAAVSGMSLGEVDATGLTLNFAVDLQNPNAVALPLSQADYALKLAGVQALSGKANPASSLPAHGKAALTLPVRLSFDDLLKTQDALRQGGGDVPYALDGGLSFDSGNPLVGKLRAPLSYSGTLRLRSILSNPQLWLQSDTARKLGQYLLGG